MNNLRLVHISSVFVFFAELGVGLLVHETVEVGGRLNLDLEDPAIGLSLVVDDSGIGLDVLVVGSDHSGHGGINVSSCLHRLDSADTVSLVELGAYLSDIQMDDISKLSLGEVGNTNLGLLIKDIC